jgi:hypothetical protein
MMYIPIQTDTMTCPLHDTAYIPGSQCKLVKSNQYFQMCASVVLVNWLNDVDPLWSI